MLALRIIDWSRHFETCESKRITSLSWVAIPNKMDGRGYLRLTRHKNVVSALAGWFAIVQIGSKMPHRGLLAKVDGPLSARDLSDISRLPEDMFLRAIETLLEPEIKWLEWVNVEWENDKAVFCNDPALPSAGRDLQSPAYRQTGQTDLDKNKYPEVGPRGPAPGGEWKEKIELAGGVVYGKADPQWRGVIADYGLAPVLAAMRAMKAARDGSQAKAAAVRTYLGKNKPQAQSKPAPSPGPTRSDDGFYEANAAAAEPLDRILAYLVSPEATPEIQALIAQDTGGARNMGYLREGKRTDLILKSLLKLAPSLQQVAYPPTIQEPSKTG